MRRYKIENYDCIRIVVVCTVPFFCQSYKSSRTYVDLKDDLKDVWAVYIEEQNKYGHSTKSITERMRLIHRLKMNNMHYINWEIEFK